VTTIDVALTGALDPGGVLAAGHDFQERRPEIFPAVRTEHLEVHDEQHAGPAFSGRGRSPQTGAGATDVAEPSTSRSAPTNTIHGSTLEI
jgi:hypothetical protein